MTFVKRYGRGNAIGSRVEVGPMTEKEVSEMRAACKRGGFTEGSRTRKLSNAELAAQTQKKKTVAA